MDKQRLQAANAPRQKHDLCPATLNGIAAHGVFDKGRTQRHGGGGGGGTDQFVPGEDFEQRQQYNSILDLFKQVPHFDGRIPLQQSNS